MPGQPRDEAASMESHDLVLMNVDCLLLNAAAHDKMRCAAAGGGVFRGHLSPRQAVHPKSL